MIPKSLVELYGQHVQQLFEDSCKLLAQLGYQRLFIAAGEVHYHFRDDGDYPFKLNPYFASWIPLFEASGSWLLIDCLESKPVLYHYFPEDIWHNPTPLDDEAIHQAFNVVSIKSSHELEKHWPSIDGKSAYIGDNSNWLESYTNCLANPDDLLNAIDYSRAYKSDYEQECIRLANVLAVKGHKVAAEAFYSGDSEFDIHLAYLQVTQQLENDLPYSSIIALNEHAAVLHYPYKSITKPALSRSFLIDAGANMGGYAADISRSYATQGSKFSELIAAMDSMQQSIVKSICVGRSYLDLHLQCHLETAKILVDFELIHCSAEDAVNQLVTQVFFPHGLGHFLGVQVHDRGGWLTDAGGAECRPPKSHPYLRLTRMIEENQVFTIEPGLYFIESLLAQAKADKRHKLINWPVVESFIPYGGIRIEDNILVSDTGSINFTRDAGLH